mmetsp:Transcript_10220/g.26776  ORF Transcript_10220/g.26776 Transcript_10220/m.26776 type:complete len:244 (-) Transcript_10220:550-1281(-)
MIVIDLATSSCAWFCCRPSAPTSDRITSRVDCNLFTSFDAASAPAACPCTLDRWRLSTVSDSLCRADSIASFVMEMASTFTSSACIAVIILSVSPFTGATVVLISLTISAMTAGVSALPLTAPLLDAAVVGEVVGDAVGAGVGDEVGVGVEAASTLGASLFVWREAGLVDRMCVSRIRSSLNSSASAATFRSTESGDVLAGATPLPTKSSCFSPGMAPCTVFSRACLASSLSSFFVSTSVSRE